MSKVTNILIVGVGGQGTILASRVLAKAAQSLGQDVKVSEIHGMAQRGGSVVTQVRFGEKVFSPIIQEQQADIILAFEKLEGLRWLPYLKEGGQMIINDQQVDPMPVITGSAVYPAQALDQIKGVAANTLVVDGLKLAMEAGNVKAVNMVLMGVLSKFMDVDSQVWMDVLKETIPAKVITENVKAFVAGANVQ